MVRQVILDRVRAVAPHAESMLMDRDTLLSHRALWVEEPKPYDGPDLGRLSESERLVFDGLAGNHLKRRQVDDHRLTSALLGAPTW